MINMDNIEIITVSAVLGWGDASANNMRIFGDVEILEVTLVRMVVGHIVVGSVGNLGTRTARKVIVVIVVAMWGLHIPASAAATCTAVVGTVVEIISLGLFPIAVVALRLNHR